MLGTGSRDLLPCTRAAAGGPLRTGVRRAALRCGARGGARGCRVGARGAHRLGGAGNGLAACRRRMRRRVQRRRALQWHRLWASSLRRAGGLADWQWGALCVRMARR